MRLLNVFSLLHSLWAQQNIFFESLIYGCMSAPIYKPVQVRFLIDRDGQKSQFDLYSILFRVTTILRFPVI